MNNDVVVSVRAKNDGMCLPNDKVWMTNDKIMLTIMYDTFFRKVAL